MPILAFQNVHALYGSAKILNGVTFNVAAGERVALVGRNGVGKTTVVNTVAGITTVSAGTISLHGKEIRDVRGYTCAQNGISIVVQGRGILSNLTVRENLMLGAAVRRKGRWTLDAIFRLFPILEERQGNPGTALSGGQQQMLAIGRALMANPELLVLDEPSEGLAPVVIDELALLFTKLAEEGIGILLIEQNISLIRRVAERYYVLSKGKNADEGRLADISDEELQAHITI